MANRNWRWISRDPFSEHNTKSFGVLIWSHYHPPVLSKKYDYPIHRDGRVEWEKCDPYSAYRGSGGQHVFICAHEFKRLFGFLPEEGQRMKMRFTGEII